MDTNENMQENVSNIAIIEVNSSMRLVSFLFAMFKEVITKRQKPKRFADVFKICCEVVFAISKGSCKSHLMANSWVHLKLSHNLWPSI